MKQSLLYLILLVFLAACAPSAAVPQEPAQSPQSQGKNLDQAYIELEFSGGITGQSQKWTIYPDGRILTAAGENTFPSAQFETLLTEIEASGFYDLEDRYRPDGACNDCIEYTITVHDGEKVKTVSGVDAGGNLPTSFWDVFNRINSFVQER